MNALLMLSTAAGRSHPIHAARLELDVGSDGRITAVVHVYQADFPAPTQLAAVSSYLDRTVTLTDGRGARIALHPVTIATEGDRLRIDLTGSAAAGPLRGQILVALLQERFSDQINVVDARVQGRHAQLVFMRGDKPQPLP